MVRPTYIYALKDPRNNEIRYIGKSNNPKVRFQQHLKDKKNILKDDWITELLQIGSLPELVILEKTDIDHWQEREIYWIAFGRDNGWKLVNITDGGNGMTQVQSPSFLTTMRNYLSALSFKKYKKFSTEKQKKIAQQTAMEYRKRPDDPVGVYTKEQFSFVSRVAERLVEEEHGTP